MLRDRVKLVHDYVRKVQDESFSVNYEILRDAFNLCHRLPLITSDNSSFNEDFYNQCNDVALLTYLGMVTKSTNSINQFVNKFNVLLDRQTVGRRVRPAYP
jgi:COP9 signalosome complex subunit 6